MACATARRAAPALTGRFLAAVALANEVHGGKRRLGTEIPYVAHLLVVTGLVLEDGGDEDQAVHNARSIVRDYRAEGHLVWERFTNKTADDQLWYYGHLLAFFEDRRRGPLVDDLRHAVSELVELVAADPAFAAT